MVLSLTFALALICSSIIYAEEASKSVAVVVDKKVSPTSDNTAKKDAVGSKAVDKKTLPKKAEAKSIESIQLFKELQSGVNKEKPTVYIDGSAILTKKLKDLFITKEMFEKLPESLRSERALMALKNRRKITIYDHNPVLGRKKAPVTIIEMTDLNCGKCKDYIKKVDVIREKYSKYVRHIHIHAPADPYNTSNPAAFYGRLAHRFNKFWEYRNLIISDTGGNIDYNKYITRLLDSGIDTKGLRNLVRKNAKQIYRELDADTLLSSNMGELRPPVIYVNGIRIGYAIKIEKLEDLINYEIERNSEQ